MDNGRRTFIAGAAAMTIPGGNPPMRPDQQLQPRSRAGTGPSPQNFVVGRFVIVATAGGGLFVYTGTPARGNLTASLSPPAGGTDPYGNQYLGGMTVYVLFGGIGPNFVAVQLNGQALTWNTAASEAGPWTTRDQINIDNLNNLFLQNETAPGSIINIGAATILLAAAGLSAVTTAMTEIRGGAGQTSLALIPDVAATLALAVQLSGDTFTRFTFNANGRIEWGSGSAAHDVVLLRGAANTLRVLTADFDINTAGRGLQVAEGANAKQGTATLTAGTVIVANTAVTANSRIFLTAQDNNSTGALRVSARTAATSFTITSSNAADTGVVAFEIFEPG